MTKSKEEPIEKALRNAKASMQLSGFTVTEKHEKIVKSRLKGEISEEDFLKKVLEVSRE
jgi:uncharacterized membrane protein